MSRIRLRDLLLVTEQAPQPPQAAPVPAPAQPTSAPTPKEPAPAPAPADTAPSPEDPAEYDFTRDFRAFEDARNKAEAAAKKKLLDKMNGKLLNKKVVANASRGYGQPKTDYTIENVKKISVEFWYKDWVVIVQDGNDKKFFLTPGINIKIEGGAAGAEPSAGGEEPQGEPQADQAPQEPPKQPEVPQPEAEPAPAPAADAQPSAPPQEPQAAEPQPAQPEQPQAEPQPEQPNAQPVPPKKKKKMPVAEDAEEVDDRLEGMNTQLRPEDAQEAVGMYFAQFFGQGGRFDVRPFVKKAVSANGEDGAWRVYYEIQIPVKQLGNFDKKAFSLEVKSDSHRSAPHAGAPFSYGYVDIERLGLNYVFKFFFNGGLDI